MKSFFTNPIVVGGLAPALFFGLLNFFYKPVVGKLPVGGMVACMAFGGLVSALAYMYLQGEFTLMKMGSAFPYYAVGLGILWALANIGISYAFRYLDASASIIFPILNINLLITVILTLFFLNEPVVWWRVMAGTVIILFGARVLV